MKNFKVGQLVFGLEQAFLPSSVTSILGLASLGFWVLVTRY